MDQSRDLEGGSQSQGGSQHRLSKLAHLYQLSKSRLLPEVDFLELSNPEEGI